MTVSSGSAGGEPGERHATWLELFFDLTAVAGVAQLAHLLHGEPGAGALALYAVMFLAFWTGWMLLTVYANVTGEAARTNTVLAGMFGMAVMAAAVHGVREDTAWAFALAYILVRSLAGKAWGRQGEYAADLPVTQVGLGLTPWVVSMWAEGTARYVWWAVGLAVDLGVMAAVSGPAWAARLDRRYERAARSGRHLEPKPRPALTDAPHLRERLGLFVLIVLGEAVAQVVTAASVAVWDWALYGVGIGAFTLLLQMWSLSLRHGSGGVPLLEPGALPVRLVLPLHCFTAGSIAALAAALGGAVAYTDGEVPDPVRLLMCGAMAVYLLLAGVAVAASGHGPWRALLVAAPGVAGALALGLAGAGWGPVELVWTLVLTARWPLLLTRPPQTPAKPTPTAP
ncbi:low temperature requirement protein A [Streptomyces sp. NPDC046866]|uniref:low temperature requirement protein A n=1 Tax=Streptomyces sp. NPDC046866 TaxID=3154921 RepID=UPI003451A854